MLIYSTGDIMTGDIFSKYQYWRHYGWRQKYRNPQVYLS